MVDKKTTQNVNNLKEELKQTYLVGSVYKYKKDKLLELSGAVTAYLNSLKRINNYRDFQLRESSLRVDNEQYQVIVSNPSNNIRIIACAGSGKTTTIICRIKYLIDNGVLPSRIILMTFNVDAAKSMKNKLKEIFCGFKPNVLIGTIDSIACRFYHSYFKKDHQVGVQEYCTELYNYLKTPNGNLITSKYDYLFIDEFQDVNRTQYNTILEFYKAGTKITVIGDDAQNIYKFRGSDMKFIIELDKDVKYLKTLTLYNNYRSTPEIIFLANKSINYNKNQIPKQMIPNKTSENINPELEYFGTFCALGSKVINKITNHFYTEFSNETPDPLQFIQLDDICIICRNISYLKQMEELIEQHNKNKPNKKIQYISLIDNDNADTKSKIKKGYLTLTTIHKSKGLEWEMVFLIGCNDDTFPNKKDNLSMEEERRLFYVAVTRAKKYLYFYLSKNQKPSAITYVSRFIQEVPKESFDYVTQDKSIFGLSTFDKTFYETDIFKIIKGFREEDFEHLREIKLLDNLDNTTKVMHESTQINPIIYDEALTGDFSEFISKYCTRFVQKSLGIDNDTNGNKIFDTCGFYVTRPCVLNNLEYQVYTKNLAFFKQTFKYIKLENCNGKNNDSNICNEKIENCTQTVIKKYLEYLKKQNSNLEHNGIKKITTTAEDANNNEIVIIKSIINKAVTISVIFNIKLKHIYFCNESMLPKEYRKKMKLSYKNYQDSKQDNNNILEDVYNISLCQNIYANRKRLIYRDTRELCQLFSDGNDLLFASIKTTLVSLCNNHANLKTDKLLKVKKYELQGQVDYIDDNTITLVRISSTDNFNLIWLMQIIGLISLIEYNKKNVSDLDKINKYQNFNIKEASVYNPIRGIIFVVNLCDWISKYEKSDYFIKYLDFVRARQNNNTIVMPNNNYNVLDDCAPYATNGMKCTSTTINVKEPMEGEENEVESEEARMELREHYDFIDSMLSTNTNMISDFVKEFSTTKHDMILAYEYKKQTIDFYYDKYYKIGNVRLLNEITKIKGYKYLILDTETNGIPARVNFNNYYSYKELDKYNMSRVVQLSWIVCDHENNILEDHDYIIQPFNFTIENSKIHGITNEIANEKGFVLRTILNTFIDSASKVDYIVCHNCNFDINILKSELFRLGRNDLIAILNKKILICTLEAANTCIKKLGLIKSSKLEELYYYFTGKKMEGAHNAKYDVLATNTIFRNLIEKGHLLLPKVNHFY